MNTEILLASQKQLAESIERLLTNLKKDGPSRRTSDYLNSKQHELERIWGEFKNIHDQLKNSMKEDHPYLIEDLYGKTKKIFDAALSLIEGHRIKIIATQNNTFAAATCTTTTVTSVNTIPTLGHIGSQFTSSVSSVCSIPIMTSMASNNANQWNTAQLPVADIRSNFPKLPPIKIPKFDGNYKEWKSFIDIFSNVIHSNPYLSNVEKMQYLLYHLEGDARKVVSHLQLSSVNYNTALQLVQARFNNNRKIITTYVNTIMDAKKVEYRSQEDIIMLYDIIRECLEALNNLNCRTDEWSPMIVCIAIRKLDTESLRLFEEGLSNPKEMPSTSELLEFLEKRYQILDSIKSSRQNKADSLPQSKKRAFHTALKRSCTFCNKEHSIYHCFEFKKMSAQDRNIYIGQQNLCINCLAHKKSERCKSNKSCFYCKKKHHTLLHQNNETAEGQSSTRNIETYTTPNSQKQSQYRRNDAVTLHNKTTIPNVLLPTAMVRIKNIFGQIETFRALIDPGSQVTLITEEVVQNLKIQKERIKTTILGVGEAKSAQAYGKVKIQIQLQHQKNLYLRVEALVLPKLSSLLPETASPALDTARYRNIILADPTFNTPGPVDLILGADVYANIILDGLKPGQPTAQNTKLGWILFGNMHNMTQETNKVTSFLSLAEIDQKLEQFWNVEDNTSSRETADECEEHFQATHKRTKDGRYIVHLPFKQGIGELGLSRDRAIARLLQMEKKLRKTPGDMAEYNNFLAEYLALNHMSPVRTYRGSESKVYYLPHHAVLKRDSTTTKLRVVFDASCKTESGLSLNDLLCKGQKVQQDLNQILLRWRMHRYVFTADIEKMFRQIIIAEENRNYQRILWRPQPTEPIQEFMLNTVTYGTAPATYLAVRTLRQLAEDEGSQFPLAKRVLMNDFYIDDMLSGTDSKSEALQLQKEIISLLNKAGFNLRKWTSNKKELLQDIPKDIVEKGVLEIGADDTLKTLGIHWNPNQDNFQFKLKINDDQKKLSKRLLLSKIATIFDPLGFLAPVTITAKLIMQSLWKAGTDWDELPPADVTIAWEKLAAEMNELQSIKIPRWIGHRINQEVQLHGFCDASERAYAAVVYTRTIDSFGKAHTTLLTARTKVAPLKQKITLPRLELCGALLLAELLKSTIDTLGINLPKVFAWCDSEIALAWIAKNPNNWHTFVANRVSQIQGLFDCSIWRHVSSAENPADVASRGISPSKLVCHNLWWRGPLWLSQPPEAWPPSNKIYIGTEEEAKRTVASLKSTISSDDILRCSSYTKQVRIVAYCLRFIRNCRKSKNQRSCDYLSSEELQQAKTCIISLVQVEEFSDEINAMKKKKTLKKTSKLLSLNPFLDTDGILRVGGRLKNSALSIDAKHQILLPQKHHVTNLIIDYAHQQTLHGGTQLTLNYIRTRFWVIDGKRVVQGRNHKCITCARHRQHSTQPLMGNLPAIRITPSPPFSHCGIDYAGPFLTKTSKGRGIKTMKGYIALFICMVTKAVHLELVSDLSTDAFLAAYRRFVARRGNCIQIFSDNGTNFVGANNKMDKDLQLAISRSTKSAAEVTANDGTEWKFIPVASPHFGGLWEAGVKSVKGHLKRVLGESLLTYEEFCTVLYQVEACLNSRPIGQQSNDPNDLEPLTPGHFLIGRPLIAPPEPDIHDKEIYQRWKLVSKLHRDIWKRWSQEYLALLQQRSKWTSENNNPSVGELVLVKEDTLPPQKWSLGRIVQLHPGEDGTVRVISVQYKNGIKKRPLNKVCQLPISIHNSQDKSSDYKAVTSMATSVKSKPCTAKKARQEPKLWSKPEHFDQLTTSKTKGDSDLFTSPPIKRKKTRIAPCTWASRLLHSTLLILYWLTVAFAQDYEIFQPKSGFYVEKLGYAQVKRGNLRLQVTFSKNEILDDQRSIDNTWRQIKQMCEQTKKLTSTTNCLTLFQHLSTRRNSLLKDIDEILSSSEIRKREKRGVLGKLLTTIFGVNDEVYTDIETLEHNQQSLLLSTNQQLLLLNTKINQSNFSVLERLKHFDAKLSQVTTAVNEMLTWYTSADHNRISIEVMSTYLSAEDYYDELQEKYNNWLGAMHNYGHLLNFITIHDINTVIRNISQKVGSDFIIPTTPQNRLEVIAENNSILLHGYLNIIERNKYDLLHVTPTPHIIKGSTFAIPDVRFPTLAVNFNQQTYFNLEERELESCSTTGNHVYICTPTIVHSVQDSPSCVIDEIYDRHPKTTCEMRQVQLIGTVWKSLMMKNTWLYMTNGTKVVAVICKESRKELLLNDTGIIHLEDGCYIKTREITLKPALDKTVEVVTSHMKEIAPKSVSIKFNKPPSVLPSGRLIKPNEQIFDYSMEPELHQSILRKTLVLHSIAATTTTFVFILAALAFKYWDSLKTLFKSCCNKNQTASSEGGYSSAQSSIQHHFDRVLSSGGPQHVHT